MAQFLLALPAIVTSNSNTRSNLSVGPLIGTSQQLVEDTLRQLAQDDLKHNTIESNELTEKLENLIPA